MGFPVSLTMSVAQRLYESGKITYMRTDSVNLSQTALNGAKKKILETYGEKYVKIRHYKTNSKGAQEAHEAIRPTDFFEEEIEGTAQEQKLYSLIWKRTLASQMADAEIERTNVTINISTANERFLATGEVLKFEGFLGVYLESSDEETLTDEEKGLLPPLKVHQRLDVESILAQQRFTQKPPRYTEASLVKKLEELGIGRPSTYAPTITTIQQRDYVVKEDRQGTERRYIQILLKSGAIKREEKTEIIGSEKAKLFPTDIGLVVNDFLMKHFEPIVDFNFTASVEKQFDEIAEGNIVWQEMIDEFYLPFHRQIEDALANSERARGERLLGSDPATGKAVSAKIGRFGPFIQIGETSEDGSEKPVFASLQQGQSIETITLDQALKLFDLPREVGEFEEKKVIVGTGKFGPYVKHDSNFVSLKKGIDDPYTIPLTRAIELILEKREKVSNSLLMTFPEDAEIRVLQGRWGPYIAYKKQNFKLNKGLKPEQLTYLICKEIIDAELKKPKQKKT